MADLRQGIEEEIRDALLRLESATEEVVVARQGRELAQRELELVRERFLAGVTSNIEVTSAQEAVARAQENHIVALTRHTDAKMALARALGATEEIYQHYLGIQ
jgi:outer membrane protein